MESQNIILGDYKKYLNCILAEVVNPVIVTDPPFNIGYHYTGFKDKRPQDEYEREIACLLWKAPCVLVHYPEEICAFAIRSGIKPERVVAWVYNSNTAKQHRDIAYFGVTPDFRKMTQPYKNPNDKRIQALLQKGRRGGRLYDWWNINQVKNVAKEKTKHPCQMPLQVMKNVVGVLPDGCTVIDPFMGSGTTGVACQELNIPFVGIEIVPEYFEIAKERLKKEGGSR